MKKIRLLFILAALCLYFPQNLSAQNNKPSPPNTNVSGFVTDETGQPLPGATIRLQNTAIAVTAGKAGRFTLVGIPPQGTLQVSFVSYQTREVPYTAGTEPRIALQPRKALDEIQIIGYGETSKRLNTGSVASISENAISNQPVTNILSALSGQAPGVFVQTTNGLPGGGISVQIRGKGSILAGTDPLYVIDGVPFASNILSANNAIGSTAPTGLISPLNSINPGDIESISVLKDADATAIYGSRGSNGVVLITTKKGKAGKTKTDISLSTGISRAASLPQLLNLSQYLQIRREAFKNDGLIPSSVPTATTYAPDLTVWDTTKSTDWARYMLGGSAHTTDAQASISGGSAGTTFNIGGNYHSETTIFPGDNLYQRGGIRYNLQHRTTDSKLQVSLSGTLTTDNNDLVNPAALQNAIFLPPDMPLSNSAGQPDWTYGINPQAAIRSRAKAQSSNSVTDLVLRYRLAPGLQIGSSAGYNNITLSQVQTFPKSAQNPANSPQNKSYFATNSRRSYILEPQLTYDKTIGRSQINVLIGGTYQNSADQGQYAYVSGFSSEGLMQNLASAGTITTLSNSDIRYQYVSLFGRITYNLADQLILNGSVRRDGSSRFGPGNQFGNFGAIGAAWIFSEQPTIKQILPWISSGKLRASYGIVGNDQISDYQFLSTYASSGYVYQDTSALKPARIANADFHWEVNRKLETAIELGLLKGRIQVNVARYQSRSSNQLVAYAIPSITGFTSYQANLPAVVENKGWEFELQTQNINTKNFHWESSFNITIPKNTLLSFPNISASSYANTLVVGEDISRVYGYRLLQVDPASGKGVYAGPPGSASTSPYSFYGMGKRTADSYGGLSNTFSYQNWQLSFSAQFAKKMAQGDILYSPGLYVNNYSAILARWLKPGDQTLVPKASTAADFYYSGSQANFFDASYIRLKNVALSYQFKHFRVYANGQNLWTLWHQGSAFLDPESGAYGTSNNLPPLRTIVIGTQITL